MKYVTISAISNVVTLHEVDELTLETIQQAVGGPIELVSVNRDDLDLVPITMYVNEEGKLRGLPLNILASFVAPMTGDIIKGDVFLCGPPDSEGNETSLPDEWIERLTDDRD